MLHNAFGELKVYRGETTHLTQQQIVPNPAAQVLGFMGQFELSRDTFQKSHQPMG